MKLTKSCALVAVVSLLAVGSARAGSLTATYDVTGGVPNLLAFGPVTFVYAGNPTAELANEYLGTRTDVAGPGVDTLLPHFFDAFCVEFGQDILVSSTNTPTANFHANVVPLLGSTTQPGGAPGGPPVFFDPARTLMLERLWGGFELLSSNTANAAAFQMAVWELAFDTDLTLNPGIGLLHAPPVDLANPLSPASVAEGWLAQVRNLNNPLPTTDLLLITDPTSRQDLIAPVPEPATVVLLAMGAAGLAIFARRGRRVVCRPAAG